MGYIHFAFLGPESQWAAEASECAAEQEKFWEYHALIYANQRGENQGAFNQDNLKAMATALALDAESFNTCLDSGRYTAVVQNDVNLAQTLGVRSTPTFLINGRPLVGGQPLEVFQQYIEGALP
jgi:protein-disulfide isomerase